MCGIVGLYLKNDALRPELGRLFRPMLIEMTGRGPDSAGVAIYRDAVADGGDQVLARPRRRRRTTGTALADGAGGGAGCASTRISRRRHPRPARDRRGRGRRFGALARRPCTRACGSSAAARLGRDLQGDRAARADVYDALRSRERRPAGHMIGHTRMATESAVTTAGSHPFATGRRPVPRAQRLAVEPQPAARGAQAPGRHLRQRERQRGGRRLPHLEAQERRVAEARARGRARRSRRLLHLLRRHAPTASRCCATRSPASTRCWPRPTTGWRWRPSSAPSRPCPAARRRAYLGAAPGHGLQLGAARARHRVGPEQPAGTFVVPAAERAAAGGLH